MSLTRKMIVVGWVYVIEGYPMGVFREVFPVHLRQLDAPLSLIGDVGALYLLWSLKFLWSPLVDRYGERRQWIAGALATMACALFAMGELDAPALSPWFWIVLVVFCAASATQDVAIDAYTIGLVDRGEEGPANAVRLTTYRVGFVLFGAGMVAVEPLIGWPMAYRLAGAASLALAASVFLTPRVDVPAAARHEFVAPMRRWLGHSGVVHLLLFVLLYRIGDLAMGPMVKPFWVDRGLSNAEIAAVSTTIGVAAFVLGAWIGASGVSRWGIPRALLVLGLFALGSNLGYALAAAFPETGKAGIYAASISESFCGGLASAAFLSFLMRICDKHHAAVQYAVLTALYALPGSLMALVSGRAVEWGGYPMYFTATAVLALPAFGFLRKAGRFAEEDSLREPLRDEDRGAAD